MRRHPDFLFIGAMKCATTSLSSQLGAQPGIFMVSNPKELFFFSYNHNYQKGFDWYCQHFTQTGLNDLCGEAATTYTQLPTYPHAVKRIKQDIPHAKLIYVMRHPIERLISHYKHEVILKKITVNINQAIKDFPMLIQYSSYAMQLEPYLEAFGPTQILPVFFERLNQYPQTELERICSFIGYQGQPQWKFEIAPKNVSSQRIIKSPFLTFWRKSSLMKPVREKILPKSLQKFAKNLFSNNLKHPILSEETILSLQKIFDQDLAKLSGWLGNDLRCNNFSEVVQTQSLEWRDNIYMKPSSINI